MIRWKRLQDTTWNYITLTHRNTFPQIVNKYPVFCETKTFIATFTGTRHLWLTWGTWIMSTSFHFYLLRSNNSGLPSTFRSSKQPHSFRVFFNQNYCSHFCSPPNVPLAPPVSSHNGNKHRRRLKFSIVGVPPCCLCAQYLPALMAVCLQFDTLPSPIVLH